jgi:hypothetical protein
VVVIVVVESAEKEKAGWSNPYVPSMERVLSGKLLLVSIRNSYPVSFPRAESVCWAWGVRRISLDGVRGCSKRSKDPTIPTPARASTA